MVEESTKNLYKFGVEKAEGKFNLKGFFLRWEMILLYIFIMLNLALLIFNGKIFINSYTNIIQAGMDLSFMIFPMIFILLLGDIDVSIGSILCISAMALGLVYGRDREQLDDWSRYIRSLPSARRFCRSFEAEYGSTMCGDIVEKQFGRRFNLADPAESMEWLGEGAVEKCGAVITTAVGIAAEIIQRKKE